MKRADLIRHLEQHGCQPLREGGSHTVYVNRPERKVYAFDRTTRRIPGGSTSGGAISITDSMAARTIGTDTGDRSAFRPL